MLVHSRAAGSGDRERGQPPERHRQTILLFTTHIFATFRSMSGIDIASFAPAGNAASISVENRFVLAYSSVMALFEYGPRGDGLPRG